MSGQKSLEELVHPHCPDCGGFLALRISHTQKNPERKFWTCHEDKCNYFRWANLSANIVRTNVHTTDMKTQPKVSPPRTEWKEEALDDEADLLGANQSSPKLNEPKQPTVEEGLVPSSSATGFIAPTDGLSFLEQPKPVVQSIRKSFTPSPMQIAIGDFVESDSRNLRVEAVAGSGKTTCNVYSTTRLPKTLNVEFMVFSKANQLDMQQKVPPHVKATTSHASGLADIRRVFPDIKVDENNRKMWDLLDDAYTYNNTIRNNGAQVLHLVSLSKNTLLEPDGKSGGKNLDYLCDRYNVLLNGDKQECYDAVGRLWNDSMSSISTLVNYDDMTFAPAYGIVPAHTCDVLFIDEQQDTNHCQQAYYLKVGQRIIFTGDAKQAIFGFRGADVDAMDNMTHATNAEQLPLSISYRCPLKVVELAKTIVPQIEGRPGAPDGIVADLSSSLFLSKVHPGDMVLCRLNAPLVPPAFELIRRGVKAVIRGRDIGKNLLTLVNRVQRRTREFNYSRLLAAISEYVEREESKLRQVHKESQAALLRDQLETIIALSDGCQSVRDLEVRIDGDRQRGIKGVFSDDVEGVTFSSVHKAKGLEADRIFVLNPELMPFPKAKQQWEIQQEQNLLYVCWTRSKSELYFVR